MEALFDRFLLRYEVDYIKEDQSFLSMLRGSPSIPADMSLEDLFQLQFCSDAVLIPDDVLEALAKIRKALKDEGIHPSDRRFKQTLSVIRAKAVLSGRDRAVVDDILILKNSLWERPEQRQKVKEVVRKHAQDVVKAKLEDVLKEVKDVLKAMQNDGSTEQAVEATKKLKLLKADMEKLNKAYPGRKEIDDGIGLIQESLGSVATQIMGV